MPISREQLAATMERMAEIRTELLTLSQGGKVASGDSRRPAQLQGELNKLRRLPWVDQE